MLLVGTRAAKMMVLGSLPPLIALHGCLMLLWFWERISKSYEAVLIGSPSAMGLTPRMSVRASVRAFVFGKRARLASPFKRYAICLGKHDDRKRERASFSHHRDQHQTERTFLSSTKPLSAPYQQHAHPKLWTRNRKLLKQYELNFTLDESSLRWIGDELITVYRSDGIVSKCVEFVCRQFRQFKG